MATKKSRVQAGPRQAQADATRQRLTTVALRVFAGKSFDTVAVSDIADAAGVAHGLVFHYFGSKRGLYLAALREVARQLRETHQVDMSALPGTRIRSLLTQHMTWMRRHRKLALSLLRGGLGTDPQAWRIIDDVRWQASAWIATQLTLDPANPAVNMMLRALTGAIDQATVHWLQHGRAMTMDALIEALMEIVAASLCGAGRLDPALKIDAALRALNPDEPARRTAQEAPRRPANVRTRPITLST